MGNFLSGLLGGVASGIGDVAAARMNTQAQLQMNAQNIAQQNFMAGGGNLSALFRNAQAAGYNPLAVLGNVNSGTGGGIAPTPGEGVKGLGQDVARAFAAGADNQERSRLLQDKLAEANIERVNAETTNQMMRNAQLARTFGQPGTPPGFRVPMPREDPRFEPDVKPAMQRFQSTGGIVVQPSRSYTESSFSALPGLSGSPLVASDVARQNVAGRGVPEEELRPDISRYFRGYDPSVFGGGM